MLALGRALIGKPKLLMLDEPSLGLAPRIVRDIFRTIMGLRERGVSFWSSSKMPARQSRLQIIAMSWNMAASH